MDDDHIRAHPSCSADATTTDPTAPSRSGSCDSSSVRSSWTASTGRATGDDSDDDSDDDGGDNDGDDSDDDCEEFEAPGVFVEAPLDGAATGVAVSLTSPRTYAKLRLEIDDLDDDWDDHADHLDVWMAWYGLVLTALALPDRATPV